MSDVPERILLIAGDLSFRGSSILALRLARGLQIQGTDTVLICTHIGHVDRSLLSGFPVHELPGYSLPVWSRIVRRSVLRNLTSQPPDVIHVLSPGMLGQALWLGNQLSCPVVVSVNDHADAAQLQLPSSARCCRTIVCVSESVQTTLASHQHLSHVEQRVIHPGIPLASESGSNTVMDSERTPVIGMAGPLEVLKGGSFFLRACHRVVAEGIDIRIVIAGSGPEEKNLRKLATSLQLNDQVTFVDDSTDMRTFLSAMDVFCLPSLQQGIGVLLLEAMALGRPVIASGVGGILTVLDDNSAGLTVPASDSRQLADSILQLIRNPRQTRQMAQAGRRLVEERFPLERMVDEYSALYAEVCRTAPVSVRLPHATTSPDQDL